MIGVDANGWADTPEQEREALDAARLGRRVGRCGGKRTLDSSTDNVTPEESQKPFYPKRHRRTKGK